MAGAGGESVEPTTATILPFRRRAVPQVRQVPPGSLEAALTRLQQALAEQRAAVAAWRTGLRDLHESLTGVRSGLLEFRDTMDGVALRVQAAHDISKATVQALS